jgi:hypothetical protein
MTKVNGCEIVAYCNMDNCSDCDYFKPKGESELCLFFKFGGEENLCKCADAIVDALEEKA